MNLVLTRMPCSTFGAVIVHSNGDIREAGHSLSAFYVLTIYRMPQFTPTNRFLGIQARKWFLRRYQISLKTYYFYKNISSCFSLGETNISSEFYLFRLVLLKAHFLWNFVLIFTIPQSLTLNMHYKLTCVIFRAITKQFRLPKACCTLKVRGKRTFNEGYSFPNGRVLQIMLGHKQNCRNRRMPNCSAILFL